MAVAKIFPSQDVINGLSTMFAGDNIPLSHEDTQRSEHVSEPSGNLTIGSIYGRFKSSPWEERVLPVTAADCDIPSSGGVDAIVTYAAVPFQRQVLHKVDWSYNGDPVGGSGQLIVESPIGTTLDSVYITQGGAGFHEWEKGLKGNKGSQLRVKLLSGGATVKGAVNVTGRRTE